MSTQLNLKRATKCGGDDSGGSATKPEPDAVVSAAASSSATAGTTSISGVSAVAGSNNPSRPAAGSGEKKNKPRNDNSSGKTHPVSERDEARNIDREKNTEKYTLTARIYFLSPDLILWGGWRKKYSRALPDVEVKLTRSLPLDKQTLVIEQLAETPPDGEYIGTSMSQCFSVNLTFKPTSDKFNRKFSVSGSGESCLGAFELSGTATKKITRKDFVARYLDGNCITYYELSLEKQYLSPRPTTAPVSEDAKRKKSPQGNVGKNPGNKKARTAHNSEDKKSELAESKSGQGCNQGRTISDKKTAPGALDASSTENSINSNVIGLPSSLRGPGNGSKKEQQKEGCSVLHSKTEAQINECHEKNKTADPNFLKLNGNGYYAFAKALLEDVVNASNPSSERTMDILRALREESDLRPVTIAILQKTKIGKCLAKTVTVCRRHRRRKNNKGYWDEAWRAAKLLLLDYKVVAGCQLTTSAEERRKYLRRKIENARAVGKSEESDDSGKCPKRQKADYDKNDQDPPDQGTVDSRGKYSDPHTFVAERAQPLTSDNEQQVQDNQKRNENDLGVEQVRNMASNERQDGLIEEDDTVTHSQESNSVPHDDDDNGDDEVECWSFKKKLYFALMVSGKVTHQVIKVPHRRDFSFQRLRRKIYDEGLLEDTSYQFTLRVGGRNRLSPKQEQNWKEWNIWEYLTKQGDGSEENPHYVFIEKMG